MKIDRIGAICELFSHAYYSCLPTSHSSWKQTEDMIRFYWEVVTDVKLMLELQTELIKKIVNHQAHNLPVSGYHKYNTAVWLDNIASSQGWKLCEKFRQYLMEYQTSCVQPFVFKSYTRYDVVVSLLEEQTGQLTRGSTGLISWQGATCLLDWADWSRELDNKRVLELGSGLGQFGLTAIQTLPIKHLTMTDFHHNVLNALDLHVKLNFDPDFRSCNSSVLEVNFNI